MANEIVRLQVRENSDEHEWKDVGNKSGDESVPVTGTFWQATQPVSATDLDIRNLTSTDVVTVTGGAGQTADVKITLDGETIASSPYAIKITESGNYTYIGKAPAGSAQASAVWQIFRIDETIGLVILWCDGDSLFNNIASDMTILNYV